MTQLLVNLLEVSGNDSGITSRIGLGCRISNTALIRGSGAIMIGDYVTIEDHVMIDLSPCGKGIIELGNRCKVKFGCVIRCYGGKIVIGARTSIGEHSVVFGHGGVIVGEDCGIGPHCSIHPSTHILNSDLIIRFQGEGAKGVKLGRGVWLGAGVRILDGVVIGDNTAIGANSVVNFSLPSEMVCVGAPCRPIHSIHYKRPNENVRR